MKYTDQDILDNLPLVKFFAKKLAPTLVNHVYNMDDLISEGNFGLMEALGRFDPNTGFKFSSYASKWIKGAMYSGQQAACRQHYNAGVRGAKVVTVSMYRDDEVLKEIAGMDDNGNSAAASLNSADSIYVLRRLKKAVTSRQYEVAELTLMYELEQGEIADFLGLSRQAVNLRYNQLKENAKRIFSDGVAG